MELYQIDRELRDLPQFYKMYSMYEMEECIENEERYGDVISRLEKMADRIETNKTIAYLEYDSAKDKVELEDAEKVSEERYKIRLEMEQQAKMELEDMYGREFDSCLFENAVEETDELLERRTAARAEKIGFKQRWVCKKSKYLHTLLRVKESSTLLYKYNRNTNSSGMKKVNKL